MPESFHAALPRRPPFRLRYRHAVTPAPRRRFMVYLPPAPFCSCLLLSMATAAALRRLSHHAMLVGSWRLHET